MTERRYSEEETAAIFARASESRSAEIEKVEEPRSGWTLTELQAIGREAGLAPEQIEAAAKALDRPAQPTPPRFMGVQIGVGRTIQLDRKLSDAEWERLVVMLRETFDARGNLRVDGSLRQWWNGNLQVLVEPTAKGDRVRFRTRNASAQSLMTIGTTMIGVTAVLALVSIAQGTFSGASELARAIPMAGIGAVSILTGWLRLRNWAPTRLRQMEELAGRLESGETK